MPSGTLPPSIESELRLSGHPHSRLRLLNRLLKEIDQLIHNTLRRIDRGDHEGIWIYTAPVKIVSKAANPLRKKDTLYSAVAFPKWMQHIDGVIKVRYLLRQPTMGQALTAETSQALETRIGTRFDFCSRIMQYELIRLKEELGITFVYVTHDQEEALTMSDTIVVMNQG